VPQRFQAEAVASDGDNTLRTTVVDIARKIDFPPPLTARVLKTEFALEWHVNDIRILATIYAIKTYAENRAILRLNDRYQERKMTAQAKLSSKFQISIPKEVREAQNWRAGQSFVFLPKGKGVVLMPAPDLAELRGIARGAKAVDYRDRNDRT
jgi:AbrB family looped-hinge helix DNA binding protein